MLVLLLTLVFLLFSLPFLKKIKPIKKESLLFSFWLACALYFLSGYTIRFEDTGIGAGSLVLLVVFFGARELFFRGAAQGALGIFQTAMLYALLMPLLSPSAASSLLDYVFLFSYFLASGIALGLLSERFGALSAVLAAECYLLFVAITSASPYFASFVGLMLMLSTPFAWYAHKKTRLSAALKELGLVREKIFFNFLVGIACVAVVFFLLLLWSLFAMGAGVQDQQKVQEKIQSAPVYIALLAVTLSPFGEEIFFRGFLVSRAGVIISSVLFAGAHHMYGSVFELGGAFLAGLVFAYAFKRTGSLVGPITAHLILNLISVSVMRGVV